jgi:hypothetical protein
MTPRHHTALAFAVAAQLVTVIAVVTAAQPVTTLEGTLASATPTSATVTTEQGQTTVILTSKTRVVRRGPDDRRHQVGSFLGVAAAKQPNGTLFAVSVTILDAVRTAARRPVPRREPTGTSRRGRPRGRRVPGRPSRSNDYAAGIRVPINRLPRVQG